MDAAYRNAVAYRDEISSNINRLKTEIDRLVAEANRVDRFLKEYEDFAQETVHTVNKISQSENAPVEKPKRPALGNPSREVVASKTREYLEMTGEPVSRNDLFAYITLDHEIRGADPKMILSTTMWRLSQDDGEFVRLPKYGYWFRGRDYAPAGYKAGAPQALDAEDFDMAAGDHAAARSSEDEDREMPPPGVR